MPGAVGFSMGLRGAMEHTVLGSSLLNNPGKKKNIEVGIPLCHEIHAHKNNSNEVGASYILGKNE